MNDKKRLVGSGRASTSNKRIIQVVDLIGGDHKKVAEGMGISVEHLRSMASGRAKVSLTIDLAAEAILRRHSKVSRAIIVVRVSDLQWPVIQGLIIGMGGEVVDTFLDVETEKGVIFATDGDNASVFVRVFDTMKLKSKGIQ
jgi:DNA-binding transcriptional regulator YdaS (Cro superfamily)